MKTNSILALGVALLTYSAARADLVVNGGFETGDFSGWSIQKAGSGSDYGIFTAGTLGIAPHSGSYMAALGAVSGQNDLISQVLTTPGVSYDFSFWLNNEDGRNASFLTAMWNGTDVLDITPSDSNFGWTQYSFTETASGPTSSIGFAGRNVPAWILLDDVSVTPSIVTSPVPEPPAYFAAGLLLLPCAYRALRSARKS